MGSPGANDNASGVSALLEMSRLFASVAPALTVRFVAFVNEEAPFFTSGQQGSMVYAEAARRRGENIRLMASLETIGWYCVTLHSNVRMRSFTQVAAAYLRIIFKLSALFA